MARKKKEASEKKEVPEGPKIVLQIVVDALDNGEVAITLPQGSNIWVLRGIIAKAQAQLNQVTITA